MRHTDLINKNPDDVMDHADQSVTPAKLSDPFTFVEMPFTPSEAPTDDYHLANKKYVDDAIIGQVSVMVLAGPYHSFTFLNPEVATSVA